MASDQDDFFSVFEDDGTEVNTTQNLNRSELQKRKQSSVSLHNNETPRKKMKITEEKDFIVEVTKGTAAAEEKKRKEMEEAAQETTLIECIHEVAYPPNWGEWFLLFYFY